MLICSIAKKNGKKILFFVGNITKNKNQMQAVEILKNTKGAVKKRAIKKDCNHP